MPTLALVRRLIRSCRGQSLVELGLLLPILLILVLGTIDGGRAYFAYVSVTGAARSGADFASTSADAAQDLAGIRAAVVADSEDLAGTSEDDLEVIVGPEPPELDGRGRPFVDVTVAYEFRPLFPWPLLPDSIAIIRTVRTRVAD